jgi:hypothetical protein
MINDLTDAFDIRLQALQAARAPQVEQDASVAVYERVRTARAICQALLKDGYSDASVVALAVEISTEVHARQTAISDE